MPGGDAKPRWALAGLAAAAAAGASAGVWVLVVSLSGYQLGIAALAVGWATGVAAVAASGGVRNMRLQVAAVTSTVAALAVSEYFIVRAFFIESIGGAADVPLLLPVSDMVAVVQDSVTADPLTLLFWGLAAVAAFRVTQPVPSADGIA